MFYSCFTALAGNTHSLLLLREEDVVNMQLYEKRCKEHTVTGGAAWNI